METPGIGRSTFKIKLEEEHFSRFKTNGIEIRHLDPPILVVEQCNKPYFYSDITNKKVYLGWTEDGRGRRFELDEDNWRIIENAEFYNRSTGDS